MVMFLVLEVQFFLRSSVRLRIRFLDDAQNNEQFQKIQKQSAHIKMLPGFRNFKQVYLWYTFQ